MMSDPTSALSAFAPSHRERVRLEHETAVASISVLRDRLDGRRAAHAAADDDGVVAIGIGERGGGAGPSKPWIVVIVEAVVALQRVLVARARLRSTRR